jgi:hypothetical protein
MTSGLSGAGILDMISMFGIPIRKAICGNTPITQVDLSNKAGSGNKWQDPQCTFANASPGSARLHEIVTTSRQAEATAHILMITDLHMGTGNESFDS